MAAISDTWAFFHAFRGEKVLQQRGENQYATLGRNVDGIRRNASSAIAKPGMIVRMIQSVPIPALIIHPVIIGPITAPMRPIVAE
jgi:hypothetical protein